MKLLRKERGDRVAGRGATSYDFGFAGSGRAVVALRPYFRVRHGPCLRTARAAKVHSATPHALSDMGPWMESSAEVVEFGARPEIMRACRTQWHFEGHVLTVDAPGGRWEVLRTFSPRSLACGPVWWAGSPAESSLCKSFEINLAVSD